MEASTLEQSSGDASPVFVAGGRRRSHAVRLVAATLGLLLAGWLVALAAALVGFSPLPELRFPGTDVGRTPAVSSEHVPGPAVERDTGTPAGPVASRSERGGGRVNADSSARASGAAHAPSGSAGAASGEATGAVTGPTSPDSGGDPPPASTPAPSGGAPSPSGSGNPPSFTPPASGEKSASPPRGNSGASPPRGNSADAPGSTVSADPPGRAVRPHSG